MRRCHLVCLMVVTAAILGAACSSSSSAHDAGGGQGPGGSTGSSASKSEAQSSAGNTGNTGSTGSGGTSMSKDAGSGTTSLTEATRVCRSAIHAQVERANFCFGYELDDDEVVDACPDYYFSADSNRTVAQVEACIPQLEKTPCSELSLNITAECLVGGKRPSGAGCLFPSQCISNSCMGGIGVCGICADGNFAPGETCQRFQCRPGDLCDETADKCVSRSTLVYAAEGESCQNSQTSTVICQGDLQCTNVGTLAAMTCQNQRRFNCGTFQCDSGSYCRDASTGTCAPMAKLGESCKDVRCDPSLRCWKGKCAQRRLPGESCDDAQPCSEHYDCVNGICRLRDCPAQK